VEPRTRIKTIGTLKGFADRTWYQEEGKASCSCRIGACCSVARSTPDEQVISLSDLVTLVNRLTTIAPERSEKFDSVEVKLVDGPDRAIFITGELIRILRPLQEVFVR
jgi:hypothetical protein